jgi:integrase
MIVSRLPRANQRPLKTKLKAVKVDAQKRVIHGNAAKPRWWRVSIGKRYTGTKKTRKFFDTKAGADDFIAETERSRKEKGRAAFGIPMRLQLEAMELASRLEAHGASLTDAVTFFLRHKGNGARRTFSELMPDYLATKANPRYRRAQEISLNVFARRFGSVPVDSIFAPAIEQWFATKNWNPLNRVNYHRDLSMFFRWLHLHDHIGQNPMRKVSRPKVQQAAPDIFTVAEVETLLKTANEHKELGLLPMYAIALFSGVRIEEIGRMNWEMVNWSEGEIRLPSAITKTNQPRNIEICDALRSWIGTHAPVTGLIVSPVNLRLRREKLFALAKVSKRRNALRHSFASYHAALFRDPGALQLLLGQQTPNVLFKHYIQAVSRADARAFFQLRRVPARSAKKHPTARRTIRDSAQGIPAAIAGRLARRSASNSAKYYLRTRQPVASFPAVQGH